MKRWPDLFGHKSVKTIIASKGPVTDLYPEIPKPTSIGLLHFSDIYASSKKKTALHDGLDSRWFRDLQRQDFGQKAYAVGEPPPAYRVCGYFAPDVIPPTSVQQTVAGR
jgi:hypothetical protein